MITRDPSTAAPAPAVAEPRPARAQTRAPAPPVLVHVAVLVLFAALAVLMTWPLARMAWWASLDYGDTLTTAYGIAWEAHALVTNPLHLFDANIMYPFHLTLTYDELNFAPALLGAPIFWLTGNAILDYNVGTLLSFVLCGYGCWLLVRELTGSSRAGIVAGVAFAFSFFRFTNLTHLTILNIQWLPLVLLWLHRLWARPTWRGAVVFAVFFALQALASHYLAFYTAGSVGLFVLFYSIAERRIPRAFLVRLAGGLALAAVPIAPIIAAYATGQGGGFHRPLWDIERYTATLQSYLAVYAGNPLYKALLQPFADPGDWPWERSLFPGLVAPILAVIAGIAAWRLRGRAPWPRAVLFYTLLTGAAFVLSFGPELVPTYTSGPTIPLPYMLIYLFVPAAETMRVITRIVGLFSLGLSVLAGFGAAWLLQLRTAERGARNGDQGSAVGPLLPQPQQAGLSVREARRRNTEHGTRNTERGAFKWAAPVALSGLLLLESWTPLTMTPLPTGSEPPPVYRWLAAQPPGTPVVEYPMMYFQRGPRNVAMINLYEYYSTTNWQPTPNGAVTIRPSAWTALTEEVENCFPCPRGLDILWALGVQLAVVHLDNLRPGQEQDFAWRSTAGLPAGIYPNEFIQVADFGRDKVYRIARNGPHPLSELRAYVRPGATLALGSSKADPEHTGAYIAALGYWLRDLHEYGDPDWGFGQPIDPLRPGGYDYALLYPGEDPAPYGFTAVDALWHNDYAILYGRR